MFIRVVYLLLCFSASAAANSMYGYYSNVDVVDGEPSGMEILLLNNGRAGECDESILLQRFEGWPQAPELVECCACTAETLNFVSSELGAFNGKIEDNTLTGDFVDLGLKVHLVKGPSVWQQ
uniref:hypothetical protein n=1 Tax=Thaumasiovibrio occultus TaxID=1891184 RepID=UPI000B358AD0|nr:hypothetical protein [Thaumasiovibrio occultus]